MSERSLAAQVGVLVGEASVAELDGLFEWLAPFGVDRGRALADCARVDWLALLLATEGRLDRVRRFVFDVAADTERACRAANYGQRERLALGDRIFSSIDVLSPAGRDRARRYAEAIGLRSTATSLRANGSAHLRRAGAKLGVRMQEFCNSVWARSASTLNRADAEATLEAACFEVASARPQLLMEIEGATLPFVEAHEQALLLDVLADLTVSAGHPSGPVAPQPEAAIRVMTAVRSTLELMGWLALSTRACFVSTLSMFVRVTSTDDPASVGEMVAERWPLVLRSSAYARGQHADAALASVLRLTCRRGSSGALPAIRSSEPAG